MEPAPEDVVLEEEIDKNYEPTEEELVEYASWLGMDLPNHKDLLWIAKDALTAPLPDNWKPCLTEEDEIYYFNFATGQSIWDHPCDEHYRNIYREEVEKLKSSLNWKQYMLGPKPRVPGSSNHIYDDSVLLNRRLIAQEPIASQFRNLGSFSKNGIHNDTKDFQVEGNKLFMPTFPRNLHTNDFVTRSLPVPQPTRNHLVSPYKGRSFDSMVPLYMTNAQPNQGLLPLETFRTQESIPNSQFWKARNTLSSVSIPMVENELRERETKRQDIDELRTWMEEEERRAVGSRISQMRENIEKKLVDEERIVLQQERVEMLERVCKQVREEESHILNSLHREILERMERHIQEETRALLAKRRQEIVEEVEKEIQVEREKMRTDFHDQVRDLQTGKMDLHAAKKDAKIQNKTDACSQKQEDAAIAATEPAEMEERVEKTPNLERQDPTERHWNQEINTKDDERVRQGNQNKVCHSKRNDTNLEECGGPCKQDREEEVDTEYQDIKYDKNIKLDNLNLGIMIKLEVFLKSGMFRDHT